MFLSVAEYILTFGRVPRHPRIISRSGWHGILYASALDPWTTPVLTWQPSPCGQGVVPVHGKLCAMVLPQLQPDVYVQLLGHTDVTTELINAWDNPICQIGLHHLHVVETGGRVFKGEDPSLTASIGLPCLISLSLPGTYNLIGPNSDSRAFFLLTLHLMHFSPNSR